MLAEFGAVMARAQRELQRHACFELEEVGPEQPVVQT